MYSPIAFTILKSVVILTNRDDRHCADSTIIRRDISPCNDNGRLLCERSRYVTNTLKYDEIRFDVGVQVERLQKTLLRQYNIIFLKTV